jgi:Ca2+-binding RTX toxin-like protein
MLGITWLNRLRRRSRRPARSFQIASYGKFGGRQQLGGNAEMFESRILLTVTGFGMAADSLTDEYVNESYDYAMNWVELLGEYRSADLPLGIYKDSDVDNWGEPRRKGYEYNWARSGATSTTLLSAGQHTGLAGQITANQVSHAVLAIGQNDFFPGGGGAYFNIYSGNWTQTEIDSYVTTVVANIDTALSPIDTNGAKLVLSNIVDYGVAPVTKDFFPDAASRQLVTAVINDTNTQLLGLASERNIPLVDMFNLAADLLGTSTVTIGGNVFTNGAGVGVQNIFVDDGIHPHTGASGIIANAYLQSLNSAYGESIPLFSEQELSTILSLTYVEDTLNFDYGSYVLLLQPETVSLPAGGGSYELLRDGEDLVVRVLGGADLFRQHSNLVASLTLTGSGDADIVTVLDSGSAVSTPISFAGGGGNDQFDASLATGAVTMFGSSGSDTLNGGSGNDLIIAGGGRDVVTGGPGNDSIVGGFGGDNLSGDGGNDTISGGRGRDTIEGGLDADLLRGGGGPDTNHGGDGDDHIRGGGGRDVLDGDDGPDALVGGPGRDTLTGGLGDDTLTGGSGRDSLSGGEGDDWLVGAAGNDSMSGDAGLDRAVLSADADFTLTDLLLTGHGNDTIDGLEVVQVTGGASANTIDATGLTLLSLIFSGEGGDDTVTGGALDDTLSGGEGADSINGRNGNDHVSGDGGNDILQGGTGLDFVDGGNGDDRVLGSGSSGDTLRGGMGNDTLDGGAGTGDIISETGDVSFTLTATQLTGLGTDSVLNVEGAVLVGGASANAINVSAAGLPTTLTGGGGNDTITGGTATDVLVESGDVNFMLTDSGLTGLGADSFMMIELVRLTGGVGNNVLNASASSRAVTLSGGDGNDTLIGGAAADVLNGEAGDDQLTGNDGADALLAGDGFDRLVESGDNDFTLGSGSLDGAVNDTLNAFEEAELTGGAAANTIIVTTFAGAVTLHGGDGNDSLEGTTLNDVLDGGPGDDTLKGEEGSDTLDGGSGADNLLGGAGNDLINGGDGNDRLRGELGTDSLLTGDDTLDGGDGDDDIDGESGNDLISAGADFDTVLGGSGNDSLSGGDGPDIVSGGAGDDTIDGGAGGDDLRGDDGNDTVFGSTEDDVLQGGAGNDVLDAGDGDDTIGAGSGNDSVSAGSGNDVVNGLDGLDTLHGDAGSDTISGGLDNDQLFGGDGDDTTVGNEGDDTLHGGPGNDTLRGHEGNDVIAGDDGADSIDGDEGADSIDGGNDADTIYGDVGNDTLLGGDGNDEVRGEADDDSLLGGLGLDTLLGADGNDTLEGGGDADSLEGNAGNDNLSGDDGDDLVFGNTGDDTLAGDGGNDFVDGDLGNDLLNGGDGNDQLRGVDGNDTIFGDAGQDSVQGMLGNDSLDGGAGSDIVLGDLGNDTLLGGADRDVVIGDHGSDSVNGGDDEDLVTGSSYKFDKDLIVLAQLLADWNAGTSYADRATQLEDENYANQWKALALITDSGTLYDDYAQDTVNGGLGLDYFGRPGEPTLATTDLTPDYDAVLETLNVSVYGPADPGFFPADMTEPNYLQTLNDPTFGTPITRITDDPGTQMTLPVNTGGTATITWSGAVRTRYVTDSSWNIDGTLMMLRSYDPAMPYQIVLDGNTHQPLYLATLPTSNHRWSQNPAKANVQYGFPQLNTLDNDALGIDGSAAALPTFGPDDDTFVEYNVATGEVLRTIELPFNKLFSPKTTISFRDGHEYVATFGVDKVNPASGISVYILQLDAADGVDPVIASFALTDGTSGTPEAAFANALDFSNLWFSPDGSHLLTLYGGSTVATRSWRLLDVDYNTSTIAPHVIPNLTSDDAFQINGDRTQGNFPVNWSHPVFTTGPDGDIYVVGVSGQFNGQSFTQAEITTSNGLVGSVLAFNVNDNTFHSLTDSTDENLATHVIATNTANPDYIFVTYWNDTTNPARGPKYAGEIVAIKLTDPFGINGLIELVHHRTSIANGNYYGNTLPTVSPDGTQLVFSSTWGTVQGSVSTYLLDLTGKLP